VGTAQQKLRPFKSIPALLPVCELYPSNDNPVSGFSTVNHSLAIVSNPTFINRRVTGRVGREYNSRRSKTGEKDMKRVLSIAMLVVAASFAGYAQTSMTPAMQNAPARKSPLAEYAGAWVGTFQGHTWMAIRLTLQGNEVSGTIQRPQDLQFADSGELKSVGDQQLTWTVEKSQLTGDGLLLTVKNADNPQTDRYVVRLTTANTAEVKMVAMNMPPGMPKPKPWTLNRVGPSAVAPVR
jgi:hypothetical protein